MRLEKASVALILVFLIMSCSNGLSPATERRASIKKYIVKANEYYSTGYIDEAISTLTTADKDYPDDLAVNILLTAYYMSKVLDSNGRLKSDYRNEDSESALKYAKKSVLLSDSDIDTVLIYGGLLFQLKKHEEAERQFSSVNWEAVYKRNDDNKYSVINRAENLIYLGEREKAYEVIYQVMKLNPGDHRLAQGYIQVLILESRIIDANIYLGKYFDRYGFIPEVQFPLCKEYVKLERSRLAISCYQMIVDKADKATDIYIESNRILENLR